MKKFLFFAAALVAFASCSSDDLVGENSNSPNPNSAPGSGEKAIVFNSGANAITRADHVGSDAAGMLNNTFVFAGTKGTSPSSFVFDQYTANFVNNTANTTESNSHNWEYVGQILAPTTSLPAGSSQTIKYWDYATTQYDFAAYSAQDLELITGSGNPTSSQVKVTAIDKSTKSYSITGSAENLKKIYISDLVTAYNRNNVNDYGKVVEFKFRSLASKIRLAFYETVPGYSVKDVKFYKAASGDLADDDTDLDPTVFAGSEVIPSGSGTMTVTFKNPGWDNSPHGDNTKTDYNKASVAFAPASASDKSSTLVLEDLANMAGREINEAAGYMYLGRTSNTATYAGGIDPETNSGKYYTILPYETGANLTLRIKYTLASTDGSGEEITVDNATAVIPKELASWKPNYAYTYIFKISDMTNGSTGENGDGEVMTGLTPITLNAVVVDSEDGVQETITTVSKPSITTYAKGEMVTVNDEYISGAHIYVVVNDGGADNVTLTVPTTTTTVANNVKLYTVTASTSPASINKITEEAIDNTLRYGAIGGSAGADGTGTTYTVGDANNGTFTVTDATSSLTASANIPADYSPTGDLVAVPCATFTAGSAGTVYVFQYIKEPRVDGNYSAVTPNKLTAGITYYTKSGSTYTAMSSPATGNEIVMTNSSYYEKGPDTYVEVQAATLTAGGEYYTFDGSTYTLYDPNGNGSGANGGEVVNAGNKYYTKVATYTHVAAATLAAGTYYTSNRGAGKFTVAATDVIYVDAENKYFTLDNGVGDPVPSDGKYMYKIIKIAE